MEKLKTELYVSFGKCSSSSISIVNSINLLIEEQQSCIDVINTFNKKQLAKNRQHVVNVTNANYELLHKLNAIKANFDACAPSTSGAGRAEHSDSSTIQSDHDHDSNSSSTEVDFDDSVSCVGKKCKANDIVRQLQAHLPKNRFERKYENIVTPRPDLRFEKCTESTSAYFSVGDTPHESRGKRFEKQKTCTPKMHSVIVDAEDICIDDECTVEYVSDPDEFYIAIVGKYRSDQICVELGEHVRANKATYRNKVEARQSMGKFCIAYSKTYSTWNRAQILNWDMHHPKHLRIQFVDFGEYASVSYKHVQPIPAHFCAFRKQVFRCKLAKVAPPNDKASWPSESVRLLDDYTIRSAVNETFRINFLEGTDNGYLVDLFSIQSEVSLCEHMIVSKAAEFLDLDAHNVVEETNDVVDEANNVDDETNDVDDDSTDVDGETNDVDDDESTVVDDETNDVVDESNDVDDESNEDARSNHRQFMAEQIENATGISDAPSNTLEAFCKEIPETFNNMAEALMGYNAQDDRRLCRLPLGANGLCYKGPRCKFEHTAARAEGVTTDNEIVYVCSTLLSDLGVFYGQLPVVITHGGCPSELYGQLHYPGNGFGKCFYDMDSFVNRMGESDQFERFTVKPAISELIVVKHVNGLWCRARVKEINPTQWSKQPIVSVYLVDTGHTIDVAFESIRKLPMVYANLPFQAVRLRLRNIREVAHVDRAEFAFFMTSYLDTPMDFDICFSGVDFVEGTLTTSTGYDFGDSMVQLGFAVEDTEETNPVASSDILLE